MAFLKSLMRRVAGGVVLLLAVTATACGGGGQDAVDAFHRFDDVAVHAHNRAAQVNDLLVACTVHRQASEMAACTRYARRQLRLFRAEDRGVRVAYRTAPDYVRRIYGRFYAAEGRSNHAYQQWTIAFLRYTRAARANELDIVLHEAQVEDAYARADRLDRMEMKRLDAARAQRDAYLASL